MTSAPFAGDPLAFRGKRILETYHASLAEKLPEIRPRSRTNPNLPDPFDIVDDRHCLLFNNKVGILGAGIGGLYTALILDSLGIQYEILEASDRAGGRLRTHRFPGCGKYDYYEQGAMRFPLPKKDDNKKYENGTMKRLAELIEYPPLNRGSDCLKDKLIPYYFTAHDPSKPGFYYFNGIRQPIQQDVPKGSFKGQSMGVSEDYIRAGSDAINRDVLNPFIKLLINDLETGSKDGWAVMMRSDVYSVRGYMASQYLPSDSLNLPPEHLSSDVINWCNLLQSSSGGYDHALTEAVFLALAFANVGNSNYGKVDWKCFEGGTETLSKKIEDYLKSRGSFVEFNQRVTAIYQAVTTISIPTWLRKKRIPPDVKITRSDSGVLIVGDINDPCDRITVEYPSVAVAANGSELKSYGHVVSTLPLTVLRTVDLREAGLNTLQSNALRALDSGPSIKIAILFKSDWWYQKLGIIGGQSFTDLPIRTIVYPSYGVDNKDAKDRSKVLIASYSVETDASRLGALALKENKETLKELVLRNLAQAHHGANGNRDITYKFLLKEYVDMHVKDWNNDEYSMGGFALFSPGEFDSLYASLNVPAAQGCLHFAGEAVSTRHGWVVGALDSAWKAVYEYLLLTGQDDKLDRFKKIWGENTEWTADATLAGKGTKRNLLEQHIALVQKAVLAGVI